VAQARTKHHVPSGRFTGVAGVWPGGSMRRTPSGPLWRDVPLPFGPPEASRRPAARFTLHGLCADLPPITKKGSAGGTAEPERSIQHGEKPCRLPTTS
jgi:hypothetical protein